MSHSKKNNSWLMPSFEVPKSTRILDTRKRSSLCPLEKDPMETFNSYSIQPKRRNVNSLSALLTACEPKNSSELVISRQKQQEILNWLQYKIRKGRPCALVLSGSSGCGKTMSMKVLSKENGFDVIEWITPPDQAMDENNRVMRQGERFEDFLIRATRYNSVLCDQSRRLLLVKDFPNVYIEDKESFFNLLEKYFEFGREPLVFVCTETGNSRLLQTLFAADVKERFGIDQININSVTQAAMKNAMKRVSAVLNETASHMLHVSQSKIDEILSNSIGDIRSAVLNLIFISLRVPEMNGKNECSSREENVGLLHGIGRVINPKRIESGNSWKFIHDPDDITAYFQSQATIFVYFLQENYLNTMREIEQGDECADILSLSDMLNSEWRDPNLNKVTLSYCTRGIMVINDRPVSGWNPVRKPQKGQTANVGRDLAVAEMRWYTSIINPESNNSKGLCDNEIDGIIE
ncbi:hypothetical protein KM043_015261 [Ampulex compressa]|nr:hypothetical protein KM043_015261 [Ampulex compressa]